MLSRNTCNSPLFHGLSSTQGMGVGGRLLSRSKGSDLMLNLTSSSVLKQQVPVR